MPRSFTPRTREQAHSLWAFVGTVLFVITGWAGIGFLVGGNRVAQSSSYDVIRSLCAGSIRIHGMFLLMCAAGMLYTVLTPFNGYTRWVLRLFAFYTLLLSITFLGSWLIAPHVIVWPIPVLWLGVGALAEGMVIYPPDSLPLPQEDESRVLRRHALVHSGGIEQRGK